MLQGVRHPSLYIPIFSHNELLRLNGSWQAMDLNTYYISTRRINRVR